MFQRLHSHKYRLAWISLGALIGLSMALAGLVMSAGRERFAAVFVAVGLAVIALARKREHPTVRQVLATTGTAALLSLAACAGLGLGVLAANVLPRWPVPAVPLAAWLLLFGLIAGAWASALPTFTLAGIAPAVIGCLALSFFPGWLAVAGPIKYSLWGAAGGAALIGAVSALLLQQPGQATASSRRIEAALVFVALFVVLYDGALPSAWNDTGAFNLYVNQASAFLHGRLDVQPFNFTDAVPFQGKYYVPFFPIPSLVVLPIVWAQGNPPVPAVPLSVISAGITALSALFMLASFRQIGLAGPRRYWALAAFLFGTGLWMATLWPDQGGAAFLAHIVAVCLLAAATAEALGSQRGFLIGLLAGCAFLSRQMTILAVPFLAALILEDRGGEARRRWLNAVGLLLGVGICAGLYMWFNFARFGNPFDTGYGYIRHTQHLGERYAQYGLFNLAYVPSNLFYTFLKGFNIEFGGPERLTPQAMDLFGTSLSVASPFLFMAFLARWPRLRLWGAWASILLMLGAHLLYFNNGWGQINAQRYSLDYLPILILLVGLGAERVKSRLFNGLIVYSIGLNVLALFFVPGLR